MFFHGRPTVHGEHQPCHRMGQFSDQAMRFVVFAQLTVFNRRGKGDGLPERLS
jgi:hypothetical protein